MCVYSCVCVYVYVCVCACWGWGKRDAHAGGCSFEHSCGIRGLYPNSLGTRIVIIDDTYGGLLYNPATSLILTIPVRHAAARRGAAP